MPGGQKHKLGADPLADVRPLVSAGQAADAWTALQKVALDARVAANESDILTPEYWHLRGKTARALERYKEARQCFRRAMQEPRFAVEAQYELGRAWLLGGRYELAVEAFLEVASNDKARIPYRVHAYGGLGRAFAALERPGSSQQALEQAQKFGLISAQLVADDGYRLVTLGAVAEARAQLVQAIEIDGGCTDAIALLADLLHVDGESLQALKLLEYGIEQSPGSLQLYSQLAEICHSIGRFSDAVTVYLHCISLSPEGANADATRLSCARALYAEGRVADCRGMLASLLAVHKKSRFRREAHHRLSALTSGDSRRALIEGFPRTLMRREYCAPNTLANALKHFGAHVSQQGIAEQVFTNGTRWHDLIGFLRRVDGFNTFAFLSSAEQVKQILEKMIPVIVGEYSGMDGHCIALIGFDDRAGVVIAQDPKFHDPVEITWQDFERSWAHSDRLAVVAVPERLADGIRALPRRGEALVSKWVEALRIRAEGRPDRAMKMLDDLMAAEPSFASARRTAVEIAITGGKFDLAAKLLDEELSARGKSYWALRYAGDVALQSGNAADALGHYDAAVRLFPDDTTLHEARGRISLAFGDRKRGRAELVHALETQPSAIQPRLELARDYVVAGDAGKARYHLLATLEIAPDSVEARALLAGVPADA
jgi:tetratricopeptide (TPR) repeat protein